MMAFIQLVVRATVSNYQSIGTRLNDDSSVNIMGDETFADEEEWDHIHILQEENILCNEKAKKNGGNPAKWNKSVKKRKVLCGEEYTTVTRNVKLAKYVREVCGLHCKFQCKNLHDITYIFDYFYALDVNFKSDFVSKLMDEIHPTYTYKKENSQRSPNVAYNFIVDGHHILIEEDLRGKHKNKKKIAETIVQDIRDHINSFPRIDSHYCRKGNDREFIDGSLDISHM
ncbi:hypothetical protein PR048_019937 [Dryococelus australis]|uniref:Uncharacterized protein n=1 Tax=Dryococelus australis TaxID=614101 RepID=A0ABQ9H4W2_9NEOP|nr:hypothetical protein PR048_019937 [Dryococelus australis]